MLIKVTESFAHPLLGQAWKGAAGIGWEGFPGILQHVRDLGKELLPLQG